MSIQSEAALEAGLIATLRQMDYEYVQITEEDNLYANFKRQLEIHNKKQLAEVGRNSFTDEEFEKILIYLEGGTRFEKAKKLRDLYPLDTANGQRIWVEFLIKHNLSYHQSRHTFGTLLVSAGVPMESIAKMMGHTNIRTTQGYAKVTDDKISEDMDRLMEKRNSMVQV